MFYLCIIIYVKVKFATSDLVSYLFNPCNFFLPIYSLYICIFFFFFVLYLQWIIIYIKNVFFGTFWCCICLPELCTSQCKPPPPRDISRHLREIFPYLTSEMTLTPFARHPRTAGELTMVFSTKWTGPRVTNLARWWLWSSVFVQVLIYIFKLHLLTFGSLLLWGSNNCSLNY